MVVAFVAVGLSIIVATPAQSRPATAPTDNGYAPHVPGVVIVGYERAVDSALRLGLRSGRTPTALRGAALTSDVDRIELAPGVTIAEGIRRLSRKPGIRYVEPDYLVEPAHFSNDPIYEAGDQWGVGGNGTSPVSAYGSAAAEAWAAGHIGSRGVYVGILDEGLQFDHPDLAANVWTNPYDPVDGRDNDGNGYVDDIHGWDFFHNDNSVFDGKPGNATDDHGTHVAGIIGAEGGNGIGLAGVNWAVTMISAKFLGPNGGSTSGAIRALDYVADLKVRHGLNIVATNNSWGHRNSYGQALVDAIDRTGDAGMLFVAAAGNDGSNNDNAPFNPASFRCITRQDSGAPRGYDCILSVASIASNGALSSFSNRGAQKVDLGAPGQNIMSTFGRDRYGRLSGTSMATPHVTGAIALCASMNSNLDAPDLLAAVLESTAATPSLNGKTVTGGRLDIGAMLDACAPPDEPIVGSPTDLVVTSPATRTMRLRWVDGATNERTYEIQQAGTAGDGCASWQTIDFLTAGSTRYEVRGDGGRGYCFRVRATRGSPGSSVSSWSNAAAIFLPAATPGRPSMVRALAQDGAASVSWQPPGSDGGSTITRYTTRASPGGAQCSTSALSCEVEGLTNGVEYVFTVRAENAIGLGPPSDPSPAVIPGPPGESPLTVAVPEATLVGSGRLGKKVKVRLDWSDGPQSSAIVSYQLQRRAGDGSWREVDLADPGNPGAVVKIAWKATHTFRVRATDASGSAGAWVATPELSFGLIQETDDAISYSGSFTRAALLGAAGGYVRHSAEGGSAATLTFNGSGIAFVTTLAAARGVAELVIDGVMVARIDLYRATGQKRQICWAARVSAGAHSLQVLVTGDRKDVSTSSRVDIDAFLILR